MPCSPLAFSSGTPAATSLDVIPWSKELLPKEPWADWADLCLLQVQRNGYNNIKKKNEQVIFSVFILLLFAGPFQAVLPSDSLGLWNI